MPRHDQLFKALFRAFLGDLLRLVAPGLASRLDLASPTLLDKEFFLDGPRGQRRELDLLAQVPLLDRSEASVLIHVEIEARAQADMARRLWSYRNQIQARHDGQVLSIVVYLRRGRPGVHRESWGGDLLGEGFGDFRYLAFGLAGCPAAEYLARPEPLAWGLAALMDPGPLSRAAHKLACLRRIAAAELDGAARFLLVNCIETYLQLTSEEAAEYSALCASGQDREVHAMAMTWADRLEAKGRTEGLRQGREEAIQALQGIVLSLLGQRFGEIPAEVRARVAAISSTRRLSRLAERVLTARSLRDMRI